MHNVIFAMHNAIFALHVSHAWLPSGDARISLESRSAKSVFTSKKIRSLPNQMSASDLVSVDSDAETGHSLTDEEIVELVTATDMDDRDEDEDSDPPPAVTLSDALVAVHTLINNLYGTRFPIFKG